MEDSHNGKLTRIFVTNFFVNCSANSPSKTSPSRRMKSSSAVPPSLIKERARSPFLQPNSPPRKTRPRHSSWFSLPMTTSPTAAPTESSFASSPPSNHDVPSSPPPGCLSLARIFPDCAQYFCADPRLSCRNDSITSRSSSNAVTNNSIRKTGGQFGPYEFGSCDQAFFGAFRIDPTCLSLIINPVHCEWGPFRKMQMTT